MDVLQAMGTVSQGLRMVKNLFPKLNQQGETAPQASFGEILLQYQDANGDGVLSSQELNVSKSLFGRLDTDGDGVLSLKELNQGAPMLKRAQQTETDVTQFIDLHDANHDQVLSRIESGLDNEQFEQADRNQDKTLNRGELTSAYRNRTLDLSS